MNKTENPSMRTVLSSSNVRSRRHASGREVLQIARIAIAIIDREPMRPAEFDGVMGMGVIVIGVSMPPRRDTA